MPLSDADFTREVGQYYSYFLGFAYKKFGKDAEDIVQQALLQAYAKRDTFMGNASVKTWVSCIVINTGLSARRKTWRNERLNENSFNLELVAANDDSPVECAERAEAMKDLQDAVRRLPERYKDAFTLVYFDGKSHREIKDALDISQTYVYICLARAREMLRERLQKHNPHAELDRKP